MQSISFLTLLAVAVATSAAPQAIPVVAVTSSDVYQATPIVAVATSTTLRAKPTVTAATSATSQSRPAPTVAPNTKPAVVFIPDATASQYPTWELLTSTNTTTSPSIDIVKTLGMSTLCKWNTDQKMTFDL
jgi:hypothetical protein